MITERYFEAMNEFDNVCAAALDTISVVVAVGAKLRERPESFMFSNVSQGMPAEVALTQTQSFNAQQWPTAEQIQVAMYRWHEAYRLAESAYFALSPSEQSNVVRPVKKLARKMPVPA